MRVMEGEKRMKYLIKGEIGLKIGGDGTLFPEICDFHIGAILTDESMALFTGQFSSLPRLEASTSQRPDRQLKN